MSIEPNRSDNWALFSYLTERIDNLSSKQCAQVLQYISQLALGHIPPARRFNQDILFTIFEHLSVQDVQICSLVNKYWFKNATYFSNEVLEYRELKQLVEVLIPHCDRNYPHFICNKIQLSQKMALCDQEPNADLIGSIYRNIATGLVGLEQDDLERLSAEVMSLVDEQEFFHFNQLLCLVRDEELTLQIDLIKLLIADKRIERAHEVALLTAVIDDDPGQTIKAHTQVIQHLIECHLEAKNYKKALKAVIVIHDGPEKDAIICCLITKAMPSIEPLEITLFLEMLSSSYLSFDVKMHAALAFICNGYPATALEVIHNVVVCKTTQQALFIFAQTLACWVQVNEAEKYIQRSPCSDELKNALLKMIGTPPFQLADSAASNYDFNSFQQLLNRREFDKAKIIIDSIVEKQTKDEATIRLIHAFAQDDLNKHIDYLRNSVDPTLITASATTYIQKKQAGLAEQLIALVPFNGDNYISYEFYIKKLLDKEGPESAVYFISSLQDTDSDQQNKNSLYLCVIDYYNYIHDFISAYTMTDFMSTEEAKERAIAFISAAQDQNPTQTLSTRRL